jgi:UPF0176 protein
MQPYHIILFYKYISLPDYESCAASQQKLCQSLELKGRIIVASEGINGTLSGTKEHILKYIAVTTSDPRFADIHFKQDHSHGHVFPRLSVRARKEIVTWRLAKQLAPHQKTGKRLTPQEFYQKLQDPSVIVIDGRNGYEYDLGHFRGAIRPNIETTREFLSWIKNELTPYKNKKIITCCTGGVRCEMLTTLMLQEGFTDVAQLDGGIVSYGKDPDVRGALFDGKCYVFDERKQVAINQVEEVVVGKCLHCHAPTENMINCKRAICNKQYLTCSNCLKKYDSHCSSECAQYATETLEVKVG